MATESWHSELWVALATTGPVLVTAQIVVIIEAYRAYILRPELPSAWTSPRGT
jgi:hypothetical protein